MIDMELTNELADEFYQHYAMPLGQTSGVPIWEARKLFGKNVVDTVLNSEHSSTYFGVAQYGTGSVMYLNREGFRLCAGYRNIQLMTEDQGGDQDGQ